MLDARILPSATGASRRAEVAATTTHAAPVGDALTRQSVRSSSPVQDPDVECSGRDLGLAGTRLPAGHFFRGFCWGLLFEVLGALLILLAVFALLFVGPWLLGELVR